MEKENRGDCLNSTDRKLACKFVTEEAQEASQCTQALRQRMQVLQAELRTAREREGRLRVTNAQLSTMVAASNQQGTARTQEYLQRVEAAVLEKLRLSFRNSLIDQKISEATSRCSSKNTLANWSTLSSCPSQESRPSKRDIRDRMDSLRRIERNLCAQE